MNLSPKSLIFSSVVLVAGVLGGTAAYQVVQASSPEPAPRESLIVDSADEGAAAQQTRDGRRPGFAPCRKPARLEGRKCVTDVVRTVTVPGGSAVSVAPPPAPKSSHHHGGDDHSGHHHGGDDDDDDDDHSGHGHGGDDDEDDHHGEDD